MIKKILRTIFYIIFYPLILILILPSVITNIIVKIIKVGDDRMEDNIVVCECQNCERHFEIEVKNDEEIICPYCNNDDVITYGDDENE